MQPCDSWLTTAKMDLLESKTRQIGTTFVIRFGQGDVVDMDGMVCNKPVFFISGFRMTVLPRFPKVTPCFCPESLAEPDFVACLGRKRPMTGPKTLKTQGNLFSRRNPPKSPSWKVLEKQSKNLEISWKKKPWSAYTRQ